MPAVGRVSVGRTAGSTAEEFLAGGRSVQDAAAAIDLGARPLLVLSAGSGHDPTWPAAQEQLATLSTNHLHRVAADATHQSLVDDPADSAAASRAVLDVVAAVRTSRPLPSS